MNIPSNTSLEEVVKYYLPVEIKDVVEILLVPFIRQITHLKYTAEKTYEDYNLLEEQDYNKEQLLEKIQELCKQAGSKKELVKAINLAFENSMVEM